MLLKVLARNFIEKRKTKKEFNSQNLKLFIFVIKGCTNPKKLRPAAEVL